MSISSTLFNSFNDIISCQLFIETNMLLILIRTNYRYVIPILLVYDSSTLQSLIVLPFIGALSDCVGIFVTTLPVLIPISKKPRRLIYMHLQSRRSTSDKMGGAIWGKLFR